MELDEEELKATRKMNQVIAREYVEKNYIHKDDLKNYIEFLKDTDVYLAETVYDSIIEHFLL